ncbi:MULTISPECIES: VWA domain-containing protein [unclassified Synechococcus]|uniref:vWA domain-containing protein n=2 Tax=Synechococcus TaxID=1129 RepID=UPI000069945A|nr:MULTISPECIES: VWA domain-containing protein [unclassified Synechococcus]EAQ76157.1 tellurium resistance protein [Synechococcus sp. WH 5701]WFN58864.1 VWA domain-containing protein [Synechococcus sp. CCFWC 502]
MPFPNVRLANRPLHFIYICDCSGSMAAQGKIQALNQAIRQSLPGMAEVARQNPEARVLVRAVSFADRAAWHLEKPTEVHQLQWLDLQAGGITAMGEALELVAAVLQSPPMEERALPPVLVLISDGQPTDDFDAGLASLMRQPWAQKAVRLAIAMGHDADTEVLQQFIGSDPGGGLPAGEIPGGSGQKPLHRSGRSPRRPLQASNATSLAQYIQWASTAVVGAASMPASRMAGSGPQANIPLPDLPPTLMDPTDDVGPLVW